MAVMDEVAPEPPRAPRVFVVAIEYAGDIVPVGGASRWPLLEHAWEVHSGLMPAHLQFAPRVAFPDPVRGWPITSRLARCEQCDAMVTTALLNIISDVLNGLWWQVQVLWNGARHPWWIDPSVVT